MRVSVWSNYRGGLGPEKMVRTFVERGWQCTELASEQAKAVLERGDPAKAGTEFKRFADDLGFSFPQGHLELHADIAQPEGSAERREVVDNLKRWLDLFAALDVKAGVLHPGGERLWELGWSREDTVKLGAEVLHELLEYISGGPTKICLENSWHYEDMMHLVDTIASPDLCVCLDTGHLHLSGQHWSDFIKWAGKRLKALHIADNLGKDDDHMLPYGKGTIRWDGFADALREVGYDGLFNFEIPGESQAPLNVRLAKLNYIRELARLMLEGP